LATSVFPDKMSAKPSMQWLVEMDYKDNNMHRTLPFSPALWSALDADNSSYLELAQDDKLYPICNKYIISHHDTTSSRPSINSFGVETRQKTTFFDPSNELNVKTERNALTLGLGLHEIDFEGTRLRFLHQEVGKPVGSGCGVETLRNLVIFAPNNNNNGININTKEAKASLTSATPTLPGPELLKKFCDALVAWDEATSEKVYKIYSWNSRNMYWREIATKLVRPVDSVVLPPILKAKILGDVDNFIAPETAKWYYKHGISYKRTYLFYGPPGAGKSSFIRVLAGHLQKNLCFLQPANPNMTDEALQVCLQSTPENSIIVIEDIDALFDKDRTSKADGCPMTFSGLLNALDGVCNRDGQLFVLTTNYIDRLDSALIRAGRVDLKVAFPQACREQIKALFLHFYPGEEEWAEKFTAEIVRRFFDAEEEKKEEANEPVNNGKLSMAALQQHFIICRTCSASEAIEKLAEFDGTTFD